jgi:hypothetical protein
MAWTQQTHSLRSLLYGMNDTGNPMPLKEDLNAALIELGQHVQFEVPLLDDRGATRLVIPIPAMLRPLRDDELLIDIQLSTQGDRFSLFTPVAGFTSPPHQDLLEALLRRQFVGGQSSGLSYAISTVEEGYDALVVIAHWILSAITPAQFQQFYQRFMAASFLIMDDMHRIASSVPYMEAFHPGRE